MDDEYLTTEQVCARLADAGVDEKTVGKVFASRMQPQNLDDPDKKFVLGVQGPDNQAFLVVYRFGLGRPAVRKSPLDESGPDWKPRWLSVEGPFPCANQADMDAINAKAKELTE